jgi:hypothetical protein
MNKILKRSYFGKILSPKVQILPLLEYAQIYKVKLFWDKTIIVGQPVKVREKEKRVEEKEEKKIRKT